MREDQQNMRGEHRPRGVSLQAQEERPRNYAPAIGLEVVDVVRKEGVSTFKPLAECPGGQTPLALVESAKIPQVVVLKHNRLLHNAVEALITTQA